MTDIQKIEFNLLKCLDDICKKLNIRYFLVCGSALGAVKYGGFIPWDDDLDVGMFREDYNRFLACAPGYLPDYYFLQSYNSSKYYPLLMAKLRDSRTTCIQHLFDRIDMNHGVYIDIFPLDGLPKSKIKARIVERKKTIAFRFQSVRYNYDGLSLSDIGVRTAILRMLFNCFKIGGNTSAVNKALDAVLARYPISESNLICNHANWQGKIEYAPKWHYGSGLFIEFEGLCVRIPEKYNAYLTQKYGDWCADLPESQKTGSHNFEIIDLSRPYTDYIEKLPNGRIRIKKPE